MPHSIDRQYLLVLKGNIESNKLEAMKTVIGYNGALQIIDTLLDDIEAQELSEVKEVESDC